MRVSPILLCLFTGSFLGSVYANESNYYSSDGDKINRSEVHEMINQIEQVVTSVHPDYNFSVNKAGLELKVNEIVNDIKDVNSELEVWQQLSRLNPYFNDGHMVINLKNADDMIGDFIANGGLLFPRDVIITEAGKIYLVDEFGNYSDSDEILKINGLSSTAIAQNILSRMHGDTEVHRAKLASKRFAKMHWLLYGGSKTYNILTKKDHKKIRGTSIYARFDRKEIDNTLYRKILADEKIGYIKIDRFYYTPSEEKHFFDFMMETWSLFKEKNVKDVIIDLSDNSGGTDHYWQIGIAPFIAQSSFPFLSKFKVRMTERNIQLGPIKGELNSVLEGPFNQKVDVSNHNGLKIPGNAYIVMGDMSYSSTILFLTAMKDSKQAFIIGTPNGARSCSTGRIETYPLDGSHNIEITTPTVIFTRPSGDKLCNSSVNPDILVSEGADLDSIVKIVLSNRI